MQQMPPPITQHETMVRELRNQQQAATRRKAQEKPKSIEQGRDQGDGDKTR